MRLPIVFLSVWGVILLAFVSMTKVQAAPKKMLGVNAAVVPNSAFPIDFILEKHQFESALAFANENQFKNCNFSLRLQTYQSFSLVLDMERVLERGQKFIFQFSNKNIVFPDGPINLVFSPGPIIRTVTQGPSVIRDGWGGTASHIGSKALARVYQPHAYVLVGRTSKTYEIAHALAHEVGHLLGLPHASDPEDIMHRTPVQGAFTPEQCSSMAP